MPKLPMDYSETIIYKIEHIDNDSLVYVGYTTNWDKRKSAHKCRCNNEKYSNHNLKLYQMIRRWDMFRMIEVEKFPCINKREAEKRESEVMKELKSIMNMRPSYVSEEEKKDKMKEYRGGILTKIKARNKEYYDKNKDIFKERQKKYRELNIDKLKTRDKEYRENNKDKIKEYRDKYKEKVNCDCGCEVNKQQIRRHQTTKKHIDLMKNKI